MATVRDALREALGQGWVNCHPWWRNRIDDDITTTAHILGIDPDMDVDTLRRRLLYGERVEEELLVERYGGFSDYGQGREDGIKSTLEWLTRPEDAE